MQLLYLIVGILIGGVISWLLVAKKFTGSLSALSERNSALGREVEILTATVKEKETDLQNQSGRILDLTGSLKEAQTRLEEERKIAEEKLAIIEEARKRFTEAFAVISKEALKDSSSSFLQLAEQTFKKLHSESTGELEKRKQAVEDLLKPLYDSLRQHNEEMKNIRITEGTLLDQIKNLKGETETLSKALRQPQVKGRWGEYTLRRVVELAGMSEYCDFEPQKSLKTEDGRLRPDLVVALPGNKIIVVDAKTPLSAYLEAMETTDEAKRNALLAQHSKQVREQVRNLSGKKYWDQFPFTPDFVVMFIPGDHFLSAALKEYPELFEEAVQNKVLLATPVNFIALMKTVALVWRQKKMTESAERISLLGKELYDKLATMSERFAKMGGHLEKTVSEYNLTVTSLDANVMVSARKFKELGVTTSEDISRLEAVDKVVKLPKGRQIE
jgi:DNA recombination protein RmuC